MNAAVEDVYRLAPLQEGLLLHSLRDDDPTLFASQLVSHVDGRLDPVALERAVAAVLAARPVLRSSFHAGDLPHPVQVVHDRAAMPVSTHDVRSARDTGAALAAFLRADRARGFDLERAPLLRMAVVTRADDRDVLVWTYHHLVLDGWSAHLVLDDILCAYDAECRGREIRLPGRRPYRDYVAWTARQDTEPALRWFRRVLDGVDAPTVLPGDVDADRREDGERYADQRITVPRGHAEAWYRAARRCRVTFSTLVQAAWAVTLSRFAGTRDVVFGTTLAVRPPELSGSAEMVGVLLNKLPTRVRVEPRRPLRDWLAGMHADQVTLQQYGHLPLASAIAQSGLPSGTPLFETTAVVENYPMGRGGWHHESVRVTEIEYHQHNNFPFTLLVTEESGVDLIVSYDRARYSGEFARRLADHVLLVLDAMEDCLDRPMGELPRMSAADRAVVDGADESAALHHALERAAAASPDRPAVIAGTETVSYGALDRWADGFAAWLLANGTAAGAPVAVNLPPSPAAVAAAIGVLKAGGAVMSVGPDATPPGTAATITVSTVVPGPAAPSSTAAPRRVVGHTDPALFWWPPAASGPREWACVDHGAALRCARDVRDGCDLAGSDVVLLAAEPSSVAYLGSLFGALSAGATVVLPLVDGALDAPAVSTVVDRHGVACVLGVTAHQLRAWAAAGTPIGGRVRLVLCDGPDERDREHVRTLFGDSTHLVEWYHGAVLPPATGHRVRVLDPDAQPVPVGAIGEVHVDGTGYTGDVGRLLPDGTVRRLWRLDQRVAVGGTVVDTGDAARRLRSHPALLDAVVTVDPAADGRGLVAYLVVARSGAARPDEEDLRHRAGTRGVPIRFVPVDAVPVTPAGEVDLVALGSGPTGVPEADEPTTPEERALAEVFAEVLGVARVGLHDSFFELGGSSLGALRMMARARRVLGVDLPLDVLFETPTIAGLLRAAGRPGGGRPGGDSATELIGVTD